MSNSPYTTVKQFVARHPAFTEGGLRYKIFNAATNGLAESGALIHDGRKVIIHEGKFFEYLEAGQS